MGSIISSGVAVVASLLGSIGVLLAAAAAVVSLMYVASATSTVDSALARVSEPVSTLSTHPLYSIVPVAVITCSSNATAGMVSK